MNRRAFLGRAAVGVVAAPAMAEQIAQQASLHGLPDVPAHAGKYDVPDAVEAVLETKSVNPVAMAINDQLNGHYEHNGRMRRIRQRSILAMRSWSPVYTELQIMDAVKEEEDLVRSLWAKIKALG